MFRKVFGIGDEETGKKILFSVIYFFVVGFLGNLLLRYNSVGDLMFGQISLNLAMISIVIGTLIFSVFTFLTYYSWWRGIIFIAIIFGVFFWRSQGMFIFSLITPNAMNIIYATSFVLAIVLGKIYQNLEKKSVKVIILFSPIILFIVFGLLSFSTCAWDKDAVCVAKEALSTNNHQLCYDTWSEPGGYSAREVHKCYLYYSIHAKDPSHCDMTSLDQVECYLRSTDSEEEYKQAMVDQQYELALIWKDLSYPELRSKSEVFFGCYEITQNPGEILTCVREKHDNFCGGIKFGYPICRINDYREFPKDEYTNFYFPN